MRNLVLPLLMLAACERADADGIPASKEDKPKKLKVVWGKVTSTDGCFFFSGPNGRDIQLTGYATISQVGSELTIQFDQTAFRGELTDGGFEVTRRSQHEFGGKWTIDEKIRGKLTPGGGAVARYKYNECQDGTACPGRCTIEGELQLRP